MVTKSVNNDKYIPTLDRITCAAIDGFNRAGGRCDNRHFHFHGLENQNFLVFYHGISRTDLYFADFSGHWCINISHYMNLLESEMIK
jgi:hypothetical protein